MNIISIDPSKNSTGVFYIVNGQENLVSIIHKKESAEEIYTNIFNKFMNLFSKYKFDLGFIEGYFLAHPRGMLWEPEICGIIKLAFALSKIPLISIPIPVWKSFYKIEIKKKKTPGKYIEYAERKFSREFLTTDEVDAFLIYQTARDIAKNTKFVSNAVRRIKNQIKGVMNDKNT